MWDYRVGTAASKVQDTRDTRCTIDYFFFRTRTTAVLCAVCAPSAVPICCCFGFCSNKILLVGVYTCAPVFRSSNETVPHQSLGPFFVVSTIMLSSLRWSRFNFHRCSIVVISTAPEPWPVLRAAMILLNLQNLQALFFRARTLLAFSSSLFIYLFGSPASQPSSDRIFFPRKSEQQPYEPSQQTQKKHTRAPFICPSEPQI